MLRGRALVGTALRRTYSLPRTVPLYRLLSDGHASDSTAPLNLKHFRVSQVPHPLNAKGAAKNQDIVLGDHTGRQQNHIWSEEEVNEVRANLYKHKPVTFSDKVMNTLMYSLYHSFNFLTGYKHVNPTVKR
jgi:hypothetical protein